MATEKNFTSAELDISKSVEYVHWLEESFDDAAGGSRTRLLRIQLLTLPFVPFLVVLSLTLGFEFAFTIAVLLAVIGVESFIFRPRGIHEHHLNSWTGSLEDYLGKVSHLDDERAKQSKEEGLVAVPYLYVLLSRFRRRSASDSST